MFIKENGHWRLVSALYTKSNGAWTQSPLSQLSALVTTHLCNYAGTHGGGDFFLAILGPTNMSGETCQYTLIKDGVMVPSSMVNWSIASGSTYASIDSNGVVTILSGASASPVVVGAEYLGKTKTQNLTLTYQTNVTASTTSQTETVEESGNTIERTTSVTEITDESGNTTTAQTVVEIITNESGETTYVETNVTENPDGSSIETTSTSNYDENGNMTETSESSISVDTDGSSTSSTVTTGYDEEGNVSGSSENITETNADGSFNSATVNYDENGTATDGENQSGDTAGNVDTQQVEYDESGNTAVTGYEIDTTASGGEGKTMRGDGVNTEFVPFADNDCGFICHMRFDTVMSEQPRPPIVEDTEDTGSNWLYNIMSAKSATPLPSGGWPGFDIRWAIDKSTGTKGSIQFRYTQSGSTSTTSRAMTGKNAQGTDTGTTYDLIITYDPQLVLPTSRTTFSVTSPNGCISSIGTNITFVVNNIDFTIGYANNMQGEPYRYSDVTIHEFSITKICDAPLITPEEPIISCDGTQIILECETNNADIYYRLNETGNYIRYTSPIAITSDTIVEAYSELMGQTSDTVKETCLFEGGVEDPVISCDGEYVTILCETPAATVYFKKGEEVSYSEYIDAIEITANTDVWAYAVFGALTSKTVSATCVYDGGVKMPLISCDGEIVTITCATSGASIYYDLDQSGTYGTYTEPFAITATTLVESYAVLSGVTSNTASATCVYNPTHDYSLDYLTFDIISGGTIMWKCFSGTTKTIQYSINDGAWSSLTSSNAGVTISVSAGDKVRFKGTETKYCADNKNKYSGFEGGSAYFNIYGNIMSLSYGDNFVGNTTIPAVWAYCSIFKKSHVVSAENLILPALTLTNYCYRAMFSYCTDLEVAPELPATTLSQGCYWYMFERCIITEAPVLNAAVVPKEGYGNMFNGCSNLSYIKCLATSITATSATTGWVTGVASSGTFVKDSTMTSWTTGTSGIPTNWVVYNNEILYDPEISCDGEHVSISCESEGADIYHRLNETGSFTLYTDPITITADTIVEAYSVSNGQTSTTVTENCIYVEHVYKFAGLEVAPGPLYYGADGYEIKDSWDYDTYNAGYGENSAGSTYFSYVEMGQLFQ